MCVKYPSHLVFNQNHRISFPYTTHFVFAIIKWRMLDEWLIEFLGECRRRTDLIRWNEFIEGEWWDHTPDGSINKHKKLFPIADYILDASDIIDQNPGYDKN